MLAWSLFIFAGRLLLLAGRLLMLAGRLLILARGFLINRGNFINQHCAFNNFLFDRVGKVAIEIAVACTGSAVGITQHSFRQRVETIVEQIFYGAVINAYFDTALGQFTIAAQFDPFKFAVELAIKFFQIGGMQTHDYRPFSLLF